MAAFTLAEREGVITYAIAQYRARLRLEDWTIRYDPKWRGGQDESARVHIEWFSRSGTLFIRSDVGDENLEQHVAHELAHLVLKQYVLLAGNIISKLGKVGQGVMDQLGMEEEHICESIAFALTGVGFIPVGKTQRRLHRPFKTKEDHGGAEDS